MKLRFGLIQFCFILLYCDVCRNENEPDFLKSTDSTLAAAEIIQNHGYTVESHFATTEDGYILQMHRIPPRLNFPVQRVPILMVHGLFGDSSEFLLQGNESLPFLFSNLGFDVWLGNLRGNLYSRSHVSLSPDDKKFWDFSLDESGMYDIPAFTDYILGVTQTNKVTYVGYSAGASVFLVLVSTRPEYNEKFAMALLLGPAAFMGHIWSPVGVNVLQFSNVLKTMVEFFGTGGFLLDSKPNELIDNLFCKNSDLEATICRNFLFAFFGSHPEAFEMKSLPLLLNHAPAGYSVKSIAHLGQLFQSGKFRQYDYGILENRARYGSDSPPDYRLDLITTPVFIYMGLNDPLADVTDVEELASQLPNLKALRVIQDPKFTHVEFVFSKVVKKFVYDELINDMLETLNGYM